MSSKRLRDGRRRHRQDRQRKQQPEQHREACLLEIIRIADRPGPGELRFACGVEHAPIGADAALGRLPRLIDRLDDVVVDAVSLGGRNEIAQHHGLLDVARIGGLEIVTGARPAEFGNDDALARQRPAQLVVEFNRVIDRLRGRQAIPVRQHVRGDEIDRRGKLGMFEPDRTDFAGGDRHGARQLDLLHQRDQLIDGQFAAVDRFVADDDGFDVAVVASEFDGGADFPIVARLILADPGADCDFEAELGGDRRNELVAAGRRVEPDRPRIRRDGLKVRANLRRGRLRAAVGVVRAGERRVGNAGKLPVEIRSRCLRPERKPQPGMHAHHEREHGSDGAHRSPTTRGEKHGPEPVPKVRRWS